MNLVKKFLIGGKIRGGVEVSKRVCALVSTSSLSILDLIARFLLPISSFCFSTRSAKRLI